ncbi:MAG: ArgE/DapE family deacylase, partial [Chloroflexi bacterium]|nr:ArgE/DapE family deacylase [Chloroflexota bacterium]
ELAPDAPGEAEMAAWLTRFCERIGLRVETQTVTPARPNVVARWKGRGAGKSMLLTGHTDVVGIKNMAIPPFEPRIEDGRLFGRGAFDMKGGLAAHLGAVIALQDAGFEPDGDIILAFVVDEEWSSIGTEKLVEILTADAAILTEPTEMRIGLAHKGFAGIEITTHGRAAHGSSYEDGIDAIRHMGRVLGVLDRLETDILPQREHPLVGRPSVHAGLIDGGLGWSTYPDRCTLSVEHRILPDETGHDVMAMWESALAELKADDATFNATIDLVIHRPGFEIEREAPAVQVVDDAFQAITGRAPEYYGLAPWLDSAVLAAAGIPTVPFGPGGKGAHAAIEYVELEDVFRCAEIIAEATAHWVSAAS